MIKLKFVLEETIGDISNKSEVEVEMPDTAGADQIKAAFDGFNDLNVAFPPTGL